MSRERTPAGNILALARSREDQAKEVEESATSYMPTDIDLETLMPDEASEAQDDRAVASVEPQQPGIPAKNRRHGRLPSQGVVAGVETKRKRISLYLDDDVLTKIFRVSLEQHEQLSSATHRLIVEALKARGL
ncbi:UNVERIFIED_ORG: hypothetical protein GGD48_004874 [Rhizobium etli]